MQILSQLWSNINQMLLPLLNEEIGTLSKKQEKFVKAVEMLNPEAHLRQFEWIGNGRKPRERLSIFKSFVAKSIYNYSQTSQFREFLMSNNSLRRLCGYDSISEVPSESTFSRAFNDFSRSEIATKVHETLVSECLKERLCGHVSRDATAIPAREKPVKVKEKDKKIKNPVGRPKKGTPKIEKPPTKLSLQLSRNWKENVKDLPTHCSVGTKKNSKGYKTSWIGYKLHLDVIDGDIPVSGILTSASLHDSQASIPLSQITNQRVTNCYDIMDSAYDSPEIHEFSKTLGHVPIIDNNKRRGEKKEMEPAKRNRFRQRSSVERVNSYLKDNYGCKDIRVRGNKKITTHLMFGMIALTATQILKLII